MSEQHPVIQTAGVAVSSATARLSAGAMALYPLTPALWLAGQWQQTNQTFMVADPATKAVIAHVSDAGAAEVAMAIAAATQAQLQFADTPAAVRAQWLQSWHQQVLAAEQSLAALLSLEQGKPMAEALAEIRYAAAFIQWFAEEAKRSYGDVIPSPQANRRLLNIRQPVGVVAAITPWNFPAAMVTRKIAPALAAGCAVILKPSELTPLTALALADLADKAGIPGGLFQVLTGSQSALIGQLLCQSPQVQKLTFTGSTAVGKLLLRQCADTVKRVSLELGGNAPVLVFADADLPQAVAGIMAAKFRNAGQTCVCINRIYVEAAVQDEFCQLLAAQIQLLHSGPAAGCTVQGGQLLGPLITPQAAARVDGLVQQALAAGARRMVGRDWCFSQDGGYYPPTLLLDVNAEMSLTQQEIFGPVAAVQSFRTEQEALALANATQAGLAAYLYTRDPARIWRCSEALQYGMVGINETAISSELIPFGGVKESGLGREGSAYGLAEYQQIKHLCWGV
jgi:succinate-semialdehyde dehydrogenase/glutarate-semialdehyde dehydrogenase